ncbi:MAG: glycogen/starch synthase [Paludibacteraceae bacterium]|nr:glycogen/starch synthase [Paludibacteraceae bacterium]
MKDPIRVLYVAQEFTPFVLESIIAKITSLYPLYLQEMGCEVRIFMPCYGHINERRNQLHEVQRLSGLNLIIDDNDYQLIIKVATLANIRMQVYFIDNEEYFRRKGTDVDLEGNEFDDNENRMIFFARGVLETITKLRWAPDVVHCNSWFSAMIPYYIKTIYNETPFFQNSKLLFSVFDCARYQKDFSENFVRAIRVNKDDESVPELLNGQVNWQRLTKFAIENSDSVLFVDNVDEELRQFVEASGKPYAITVDEDNRKEAYYSVLKPLIPSLED